MWYLLILASIKAECDISLNDADDLNPECNYAGECVEYEGRFRTIFRCECCDFTEGEDDECNGKVPGSWEGDNCGTLNYYTQTTWGYVFESDGNEITCANDGISTSVPDLLDVVTELISTRYDGEILSFPCEICTPNTPCSFFAKQTDKPPAESGIFLEFGTDLNSYYDQGCAYGNLPLGTIRPCDANWDGGATAFVKLMSAIDRDNDYAQHMSDLQNLLVLDSGNGLGWSSTSVTRAFHQQEEVTQQNILTTRLPTPSPTLIPTVQPTKRDTTGDGVCSEYVNSVGDLIFIGAGSSCRANINESWTGGRTCESPYIVCLPDENTPTNDMMGNPYKNVSHRYSVAECLQECAYDQRCLGIEFVADGGSTLGDCNLIDDIPIGAENPEFQYDYNAADTSLDKNVTGRDALCWAKGNYCNPYFEADDLNDAMLKCYCPNNRKGFYTKRVKRTVNNTRYCGNDSLVEERLKKAQANRMFHLCENWCLFDTLSPERENWYWDPWKTCWRETYSGVGAHNSYCDRVIRNPDSIEFKFLSYRSDIFCDLTKRPTFAPVSAPFNWTLAEKRESCDDACSAIGAQCAEEATATVFGTEAELASAFEEAGHICDPDLIRMNETKWEGWALPGVRSAMVCANRLPTLSHLDSLDTGCSRILGGDWQRLCACFVN